MCVAVASNGNVQGPSGNEGHTPTGRTSRGSCWTPDTHALLQQCSLAYFTTQDTCHQQTISKRKRGGAHIDNRATMRLWPRKDSSAHKRGGDEITSRRWRHARQRAFTGTAVVVAVDGASAGAPRHDGASPHACSRAGVRARSARLRARSVRSPPDLRWVPCHLPSQRCRLGTPLGFPCVMRR